MKLKSANSNVQTKIRSIHIFYIFIDILLLQVNTAVDMKWFETFHWVYPCVQFGVPVRDRIVNKGHVIGAY